MRTSFRVFREVRSIRSCILIVTAAVDNVRNGSIGARASCFGVRLTVQSCSGLDGGIAVKNTTGIKLTNVGHIKMTDVEVHGFDIGIDADQVGTFETTRVVVTDGGHRYTLTEEEVAKVREIIASTQSKEEAVKAISQLDNLVLWTKGNAIDQIALAISVWSTFKT